MTSTPARGITPGLPTNSGSFKASERPESGVNLASLGVGTTVYTDDLTDNQQRLLAVLLDPALGSDDFEGTSPEDIAEQIEDEFGSFDGGDAYYDAQRVANILGNHYRSNVSADGTGDFTFGFESNSEGEVQGYNVGVYTGHQNGGLYLTRSHETKYLTSDRSATGLKAALAYAESLDADYQDVLSQAKKAGLIKDQSDPMNRPIPYGRLRDAGPHPRRITKETAFALLPLNSTYHQRLVLDESGYAEPVQNAHVVTRIDGGYPHTITVTYPDGNVGGASLRETDSFITDDDGQVFVLNENDTPRLLFTPAAKD